MGVCASYTPNLSSISIQHTLLWPTRDSQAELVIWNTICTNHFRSKLAPNNADFTKKLNEIWLAYSDNGIGFHRASHSWKWMTVVINSAWRLYFRGRMTDRGGKSSTKNASGLLTSQFQPEALSFDRRFVCCPRPHSMSSLTKASLQDITWKIIKSLNTARAIKFQHDLQLCHSKCTKNDSAARSDVETGTVALTWCCWRRGSRPLCPSSRHIRTPPGRNRPWPSKFPWFQLQGRLNKGRKDALERQCCSNAKVWSDIIQNQNRFFFYTVLYNTILVSPTETHSSAPSPILMLRKGAFIGKRAIC